MRCASYAGTARAIDPSCRRRGRDRIDAREVNLLVRFAVRSKRLDPAR
jgi:hypothetical protein